MKTKKILAGALAAAVVTTSLPGMGVPVFAQTEYGTTLFENRYTDTGSSAIIRYYCYIPCTSTLLQATACHIFHTLYVLSFLICY